MIKFSKYFTFWFLCVLAMNACKRENLCDCIKGTGKREAELRQVPPFTKLYMRDKMNVHFTQTYNNSFEVMVECGSSLLPLVKTEVIEGELRLRNDNKCNWMRSYKKGEINIFVKAPYLFFITNDGVGNFYCENTLIEDVLDYTIKGAGDINLEVQSKQVLGHLHGNGDAFVIGKSDEHIIHATGQCFVDASKLNTSYTWVHHNSSGEIKINAIDKIAAQLYSSGNLYYTNNPAIVEYTRYAKGQLIHY